MKKTKTIYIKQEAVPVSEAVYRAYWQSHEQARYQDRQAACHTWSLTDLAASGVPEDALAPLSVPGGEADYLARLDLQPWKRPWPPSPPPPKTGSGSWS